MGAVRTMEMQTAMQSHGGIRRDFGRIDSTKRRRPWNRCIRLRNDGASMSPSPAPMRPQPVSQQRRRAFTDVSIEAVLYAVERLRNRGAITRNAAILASPYAARFLRRHGRTLAQQRRRHVHGCKRESGVSCWPSFPAPVRLRSRRPTRPVRVHQHRRTLRPENAHNYFK